METVQPDEVPTQNSQEVPEEDSQESPQRESRRTVINLKINNQESRSQTPLPVRRRSMQPATDSKGVKQAEGSAFDRIQYAQTLMKLRRTTVQSDMGLRSAEGRVYTQEQIEKA